VKMLTVLDSMSFPIQSQGVLMSQDQNLSAHHMLGSWLSNFDLKEKKYILVGVAALCWAIWRCRND
jgi:hypothetical protein